MNWPTILIIAVLIAVIVLLKKSGEPLWHRAFGELSRAAECPGHRGAGILLAVSLLSGSFNFPAGQDV